VVGLLPALRLVVNRLPSLHRTRSVTALPGARGFSWALPRFSQRVVATLVFAVSVGWPGAASADAGAAAESLFVDGRRLMEATRYAEACRRFEDSQRLEPAVGTALNLARCYALTQRTASAWTLYREAAALASVANQYERERAALAAAAALEPKLAKLILKHERPQPGLFIELDGNAAPESLFSVATPVDPAEHEVVVSKDAKVLWRTSVQAIAGQVVEVAIPGFDLEPIPATGRSSGRSRAPLSSTSSNRDSALSGVRRTAVIGLAATSALAVGYAVFEALRARDAYEESDGSCDRAGRCNTAGLQRRELAFDRARRADIALVFAGGAALGAGVLWFTVGSAPTGAAASTGRVPRWQASWHARF
jgi:hypothetical protein